MIDNYRNTGLVPPRNISDGTPEKTTAEIVSEQIEADNPVSQGKRDVAKFLEAGVDPDVIVNLVMIRNRGLRQLDAVRIVNEIAGTQIDSRTFVFKISAADMDLGDAPTAIRKDPRAERLLSARRDAERYISSEMSFSEVLQGIILRNNITQGEAQAIVDDLTSKP